MSILHLLRSNRKKLYLVEFDYAINRGKQSHLAIETLVSLRDLDIEEDDELKAKYFFYTDTVEKAIRLSSELKDLGYVVQQKSLLSNDRLFVIKGQTTPIKMMHEVLRKWAIDMCDLGYKYDCDFERWKIVTSEKKINAKG